MSDEPSAPDDEFAALPAQRRGKSPVLALVVVALAGLIGWHLRSDVGYAFAGRQPVDLGDDGVEHRVRSQGGVRVSVHARIVRHG